MPNYETCGRFLAVNHAAWVYFIAEEVRMGGDRLYSVGRLSV